MYVCMYVYMYKHQSVYFDTSFEVGRVAYIAPGSHCSMFKL